MMISFSFLFSSFSAAIRGVNPTLSDEVYTQRNVCFDNERASVLKKIFWKGFLLVRVHNLTTLKKNTVIH